MAASPAGGQDGPLAKAAGHDLNYIALSGALDAIGRHGQPPTPPLNLIGDYGGAVYLCMGMLAALHEAQNSGQGQVVDAAMVDAATSLMTSTYGLNAAGMHNGQRGTNILDSGMPTYDVYECADGRYVSIAPIEKKFRDELFALIGLSPEWSDAATDRAQWPALHKQLAAIFKSKTQDHWCALLEGTDACFAPVLSLADAKKHPHQEARSGFISVGDVAQPAPAPRFSRSIADTPSVPEAPGETGDDAMREWDFSETEILDWKTRGGLLERGA